MNEENKPINENEHTYDNGFHPKAVKLKENYKFYPSGFFYKLWQATLVILFQIIFFIPKYVFWGFRIKGRKNKKYMKGTIMISNHTIPIDAMLWEVIMWPTRKFYVTMLESNLGFGIASWVFRGGGAAPIPTELHQLKRFYAQTEETLKKGGNILVYAEAALMPYCDHVRNFLPGAFQFAVQANGVIIPACITYHNPRGFYKLTRGKKPCPHMNILEPYKIKDMGSKKQTIAVAAQEVNKIISDYFIKNSDYYYDKDGNKIRSTYTKKKKNKSTAK